MLGIRTRQKLGTTTPQDSPHQRAGCYIGQHTSDRSVQRHAAQDRMLAGPEMVQGVGSNRVVCAPKWQLFQKLLSTPAASWPWIPVLAQSASINSFAGPHPTGSSPEPLPLEQATSEDGVWVARVCLGSCHLVSYCHSCLHSLCCQEMRWLHLLKDTVLLCLPVPGGRGEGSLERLPGCWDFVFCSGRGTDRAEQR